MSKDQDRKLGSPRPLFGILGLGTSKNTVETRPQLGKPCPVGPNRHGRRSLGRSFGRIVFQGELGPFLAPASLPEPCILVSRQCLVGKDRSGANELSHGTWSRGMPQRDKPQAYLGIITGKQRKFHQINQRRTISYSALQPWRTPCGKAFFKYIFAHTRQIQG